MALYLVTGGAGFIGSNLVEALLKQGETVRVLDNFSTGKEENLLFINELALPAGRFTLLKGDIRDLSSCHQACEKVDFVLHQAALGSVPRSVNDPITTNEEQQEGRVVSKVESQIPNPQSPYAISKLTGEYYCRVFHKIYELKTISLRYFNVFGQRQDAHSAYAAVVPKFIQSLLNDQSPTIYGDGEQSRDFSHIDNVVQANCNACYAPQNALGEAINIACGARTTVNQLYASICETMNKSIKPLYASPRPGDVRHSLAEIGKARNLLNYDPQVNVATGIKKSIEWFSNHFQK